VPAARHLVATSDPRNPFFSFLSRRVAAEEKKEQKTGWLLVAERYLIHPDKPGGNASSAYQ
jgi:hypothetical protein